MSQECFVVGTLVHTDKGLTPIEQIKDDDFVLSKHENGEGGQAYKRVVRAFKSQEKQHIIYVDYGVLVNNPEDAYSSILFCSANINFRVSDYFEETDIGWIAAFDLASSESHMLTTYNGDLAGITTLFHDDDKIIRASPNGEIAYLHHNCRRLDCIGIIDFRGDRPMLIVSEYLKMDSFTSSYESESLRHISIERDAAEIQELNELLEEAKSNGVEYIAHVYNLEVEEFHTYYVGKAGVLVHDLAQLLEERLPHSL
jgi:transcription-repair coupling factor (superfamily II helicase)